jgi:cellulose synthase/poly-beta-1,6-N-acetylglucosamine synthase-like glycosyltransferase
MRATLLILGVLCILLLPGFGVGIAIALCGVTAAGQISFMVARAVVTHRTLPRSRTLSHTAPPVFSVHVATHNEPPVMVARTLRALVAQDWPAEQFEIILIDNNTADPALWRPIQQICKQLGRNVRFLHRMGVVGAKAGALNIALMHTRSDATHIVTVDADYIVVPQFLSLAAEALQTTGADYVQFPQAYMGCDTVAAGVDAELEEYFRTNARMADGSEAVLLTGTLCVVSKAALTAAGGWSGRTTTEDAEMGVRLCSKGFSGRFIDRVVGRGYLPFSLRDLEQQRHRWASGNLQTLMVHAPAILLGRDAMGWRRQAAILSQLTAWLNLSLLPTFLFLAALLSGQGGPVLITLAALCVVLSLADILGRLVWRCLRDGTSFMILMAAIGHRLALAPVSAIATIEALMGRPMTFVVTDKSGTCTGASRKFPLGSLFLFTAALFAMPAALLHGWLPVLAALSLMLPFPAGIATARTLDCYRATLATPQTGAAA